MRRRRGGALLQDQLRRRRRADLHLSNLSARSEEHTSELQSRFDLVCRLLLDPPPPCCSPLSLHDALPISTGPSPPSMNACDARRAHRRSRFLSARERSRGANAASARGGIASGPTAETATS